MEIHFYRRGLKALFHGNNFCELGLLCAKIFATEVDPLTTNIVIYNDSLTLMLVIFTTFLHFARNFHQALEIPSEKKISSISYFGCVKGLFLHLFSCKTKFHNFSQNSPLDSFKILHQKDYLSLAKDLDFIYLSMLSSHFSSLCSGKNIDFRFSNSRRDVCFGDTGRFSCATAKKICFT